MSKLRVGVLRGGPSSEYEVSLKTGGNVLKNLSSDLYTANDIFISRNGKWHVRGLEKTPDKVLKNIDVVFNALHGEYGEDGKVQQILDVFQIPYTGSGSLASALAINKPRAKELVSSVGINVPLHVSIKQSPDSDIESIINEVFRTFPQPVVIKPINKGSSLGVVFAGSYQEFVSLVKALLEEFQVILIEEFIKGKEVTSGVIDNFRGEKKYTLLPIEIVLPKGKVCFDYDAKYNTNKCGDENAEFCCPGGLTSEEKLQIKDATQKVHDVLGLRHYSRSDFIVTPRGVYFLETNTLPELTENSLVLRALNEVGCSFPEFLNHVINLAVDRK